MLDIGWSELLIIGIVALVVVGPKELPKLLRVVGQMLAKVRRMASEFQGQVNEAIREAELEDVKKSVEDLKSYNPATMIRNEIDNALAPVTAASQEVTSEMARIEAGLDAPPVDRGEGGSEFAPPPPPPELAGPPDFGPAEVAPHYGPTETAPAAIAAVPDHGQAIPVEADPQTLPKNA